MPRCGPWPNDEGGVSYLATAGALMLAGAAPTTFLNVVASNVRNSNGHVLAAVCSAAEFLAPQCRYVGKAPAHPGTVTVRVSGIPPGTYAVQVFQDENDNLKIDRNFLGMPKEGIGFSNNAPFRFGPPRFRDAAITLGSQGGTIAVRLRYLLG
jgi:uncharacterized protein (DUF2141 family)